MADEQAETTTLAQVAEGDNPAPTVADVLRQGYQKALEEQGPKDVLLLGYGEPETELHVALRALDDYEEVRDDLRKVVSKKGGTPAQREIAVAIETLRLAAEGQGSYAIVNGERHDIGLPLGLPLYAHLFPDSGPVTNDAQAITLLFHSKTSRIMREYTLYELWLARGGQEAEDDLLGE